MKIQSSEALVCFFRVPREADQVGNTVVHESERLCRYSVYCVLGKVRYMLFIVMYVMPFCGLRVPLSMVHREGTLLRYTLVEDGNIQL
jgi:hypothetical protein